MYVDPSEGRAGRALDTIYGAATSGALKVDPRTGETTLKFLNHVQDLAEAMARRARDADVDTPLGGGFGEEIGALNRRLASGGSDSAREMLTRFSAELERLKDAVAKSMASYHRTDAAGARTITIAGVGT